MMVDSDLRWGLGANRNPQSKSSSVWAEIIKRWRTQVTKDCWDLFLSQVRAVLNGETTIHLAACTTWMNEARKAKADWLRVEHPHSMAAEAARPSIARLRIPGRFDTDSTRQHPLVDPLPDLRLKEDGSRSSAGKTRHHSLRSLENCER